MVEWADVVRYERALRDQPHYEALAHPLIQALGWALIAAGQILVVTSIYALGITGQLLSSRRSEVQAERV